jgi:DNA polymerase I-like protein with 3'-5' exonuclease and polymerase domains
MSPKTLSLVMNLCESEASAFIDSFKSAFPGLKKFIVNQIENCRIKGYVESIRRRKRFFPNINSSDIKLRTQAERQAINTLGRLLLLFIIKKICILYFKYFSSRFRI